MTTNYINIKIMIILHPIIRIIIILNLSRLRGRLYAHVRLSNFRIRNWVGIRRNDRKCLEMTGNIEKCTYSYILLFINNYVIL